MPETNAQRHQREEREIKKLFSALDVLLVWRKTKSINEQNIENLLFIKQAYKGVYEKIRQFPCGSEIPSIFLPKYPTPDLV